MKIYDDIVIYDVVGNVMKYIKNFSISDDFDGFDDSRASSILCEYRVAVE